MFIIPMHFSSEFELDWNQQSHDIPNSTHMDEYTIFY